MTRLNKHESKILRNEVSPTSMTPEETGRPPCDGAVLDEERKASEYRNRYSVRSHHEKNEARRLRHLGKYKNGHGERVGRIESPLETMAMIACRIGASLSDKERLGDGKQTLVVQGSESRESYDDDNSYGSRRIVEGCENNGDVRRDVDTRRGNGVGEVGEVGGMQRNRGGSVSDLASAFDDLRELTSKTLGELRKLISQQYDVLSSQAVSVRREMNMMKSDMQSFKEEYLEELRAINVSIQGRNISGALEEGTKLRLTTERNKKCRFIISGVSTEGGRRVENGCGDEILRTEAASLTISVEPNGNGKRGLTLSGSGSSGYSLPQRACKQGRGCGAENGMYASGCDEDEEDEEDDVYDCNKTLPNKLLRRRERASSSSDEDGKEGGGLHGGDAGRVGSIAVRMGTRSSRRGRSSCGGNAKRKRDNWTGEENGVFMRMVVDNLEMEEMDLRRMLARHFAPRRTHEQCANHLRILRAQKKLPPAREELHYAKSSRPK